MDKIRRRISDRLTELGKSHSWLSVQLGRHRGYIHDYIQKGSPNELSLEDRIKVAKMLRIDSHELGIRIGGEAPPAPGLMEANAEPYIPGSDDLIVPRENINYFMARTNGLDQHEHRIKKGEVVAFNTSAIKRSEIESGEVVLVTLSHKKDPMRPIGTVMMEFVAPNKLITNSSSVNVIINMDDEDGPYEAVIMGTYAARYSR